MLTKVDK